MSANATSLEQRLDAALRRVAVEPAPDVLATLRALLVEAPGYAALRRALIRCLLISGDFDAALAVARNDAIVDAATVLAEVLVEFGSADAHRQHAELLRERARRHPLDYDAALALASASHALGHAGEALRWSEHAHALRPAERLPIEIRATTLIDRGDVEVGLALYGDLLATHEDAALAARHLVLMHYDPAQTNARLFDALQAYSKRHLQRVAIPFRRARTAVHGRALRVGWLSPRFGAGPVATFLEGLLAAFDRRGFRHILIALQPMRDTAALRLAALAGDTIDLSGLDDANLLQRLRALELDVLIDLAGHSTANRLAVIAQRVAPVQVSWLDWFDTTAAPNIDAWLSDAWLTPDDSTQRYTERVLRLDSGRFCYTPPPDPPAATHAGDDAVVFASFNRLAKLNADVVATWSAILQRVPGSRLELGTQLLDDAATRDHTLQRFAACGIGAERLALHGQRVYGELLAAYRGVDIALDPFPFSGCATTCDALFMGAAVITLPGETFVSRQSASLLWRLDREHWVADDRADYIERAVAAAATVADLRAGREALRAAVRTRLCDARRQAGDFASALRALCATAAGD